MLSEPEYKDELETRWEKYFDFELDRTKPVDVTSVGVQLFQFLQQKSVITISILEICHKTIPSPFHKKVLIVGSASGGKTTLVKDLARVYNAPYSLEYAREYQRDL